MEVVTVADTSLLVRLDRKRGIGLLADYVKRTGHSIVVSPHVRREVVDRPKSEGIYLDSVERIEKLIQSKVIRVQQVEFDKHDVSEACDNARKRIAALSGRDEHLIERADVEIIGLAVQLCRGGKHVRVVLRDAAMEEALKSQITARNLSISIVDADDFIEELRTRRL